MTIVLGALHAYAGNKEMVRHRIQPKENLFRISLQYNSTVADIVRANPGLNPDKVRSGTTIKIPKDTKIRDVAFVAAFFKTKTLPSMDAKQATAIPPTQTVNPEDILEDENPFITPPKKRKTIEQQERESALENNVSQKTLVPAPDAISVPAGQIAKPAAADAASTINYSAMALPTPVSIYEQQADLQADRINTAPRAEVKPFNDPAATSSPATARSSQFESEELQRRYAELMRMASQDKSVRVIDMTHIKVDSTGSDSRYADLIKQLNLMIDATQVETINLEIVMKDGSVKIISSPDEQRKVLSQLVSGE